MATTMTIYEMAYHAARNWRSERIVRTMRRMAEIEYRDATPEEFAAMADEWRRGNQDGWNH
jgi:hypothetical protein